MSFPFSMGGLQMGTRTTILRSADQLVLISPGPFSEEDFESVEELGEVGTLAAPNLMHHLFMDRAVARYPSARVLLAPGLDEKRPDLKCDEVLSLNTRLEGLEHVFLEGMPRLNECVFYHGTSRTLILTDLAFNFVEHDHRLTRWFLTLNRAYRRFGPSRLLRHLFLRDAASLRTGLEKVLEWPFERIVVAHGEVLESSGREVLRQSYAWLLGGVPSR